MNNIRFAFFGTPELVIPILNELEKNNLIPSLVVTGPDMPKGRKLVITPPAPKVWANERNIRVLQPGKIDSHFIEEFQKIESFDLGIVVAYGKILPEKLLEIPKYGMLNIHYSLLPKYRGATPVESAILGGDKETGVAIQKMVYKLDAGDVLAETKVEIGDNETAPALRERLNDIAKVMLPKVMNDVLDGKIVPKKQDEGDVTTCSKIKKQDGLINLSDDGLINYEKFRAYFGWPGTYFFITHDGREMRVKIADADFVDGKFEIKKVVPEGKREIDYADFLRGYGGNE